MTYRTAINSHQENTATSYAQILSRDSSPNLQKTQELLSELETLHSLCDIDSLVTKLKKLNLALENCKTEQEQLFALLEASK